MRKKQFLIAGGLFFLPLISFAADVKDLKSLITDIVGVINSLVPVLIGIAMVLFIWGIIRYVIANSPEKVSEARNYMILGIVGLTVMLSVWGLAFLVKNTLFPNAQLPTGFSINMPLIYPQLS